MTTAKLAESCAVVHCLGVGSMVKTPVTLMSDRPIREIETHISSIKLLLDFNFVGCCCQR